MNNIEIRVATAADATAIGLAHSESWRVGYVDLFSPEVLAFAVAERLERWPRQYADPKAIQLLTFVPVLDGKVVGLSTVRTAPEEPGVGEVLGFYLHPDVWGSGAASALMDHSLKHFVSQGFTEVLLWTHPGADRAHGFYRKAGFAPTGRKQSGVMIEGAEPVPTVEFRLELSPQSRPSYL